ncbi:MAG: hypothetical protein AAF221_15035 [Pseudomonadota bacterium]
MGNRHLVAEQLPTMLAHEGTWVGEYQHVDLAGAVLDRHDTHIVCEFPDDGPHVYIQHNTFTWADGREYKATLPGVLKDGMLWWDVETFHGKAWQSEVGIILLHLIRKDVEGGEFFEMIVLGQDGVSRARTWHWFEHGTLTKRTLCNERKLAP